MGNEVYGVSSREQEEKNCPTITKQIPNNIFDNFIVVEY